MEVQNKKRDATRGPKHAVVRVIGCIALFALGACVQIAGITKPTLLDENAGGAGGDGGNVNSGGSGSGAASSSASSSSSSGSIPCMKTPDCPLNNACENWSCTMGMCMSTFSPMGTVVNDPTNGDCRAEVCNGIGNVIPGNDDNDVPPDDGTNCTLEGCESGTPKHSNAASGTSCPGGACNGNGMCLNCDMNADCIVGTCVQNQCASCGDGVKNGDETGVDCGGTYCTKKCNGDACAIANDCKSTFCADGVCCDAVCTGTCKSCNLAATVGVCTNIPLGSSDSAPVCNGTQTCNGMGACKLNDGEPCNNDSECVNNACIGTPKKCAL